VVKDLTQEETDSLREEFAESQELAHPSAEDLDEAIDYYLSGIETGVASANALGAAVFLLEETRLENQALKAFITDPSLKSVTVTFQPLERRSAGGEEDKIPNKMGLLGFLLGERTYTRQEILGAKNNHENIT
jgi:hypothetical protein